jgi:nicotinate-nucleotide pyrophosphorylase (carboxylating)
MNLPDDIGAAVRNALDEDIRGGDVTAQLIPVDAHAIASVVCRERAVLCGTAWFDAIFHDLDDTCVVSWNRHDGDQIGPNETVCTLEGPARALVSGERAALNFLQTLSGTATTTRRYVDSLASTDVTLLDTRKTIPGLRNAQKYAVGCGGGKNHRIGLFDGILIKENHIAAAGSIAKAIAQMRTAFTDLRIEVEVESIAELTEAIAAGADMLLLDNFSNEKLRRAVKLAAGQVKLEASGGFEFESIRAVAETGVDFVSVGALTKHLRAIDFSIRFRAETTVGAG